MLRRDMPDFSLKQELASTAADNSLTNYTSIHFGALDRDLSGVVLDGAKADGSMTTQVFYVEDGLLKGYILVGDCLENAGVYTALIRERTPLSAVDFGLLRQHPRFAAFSRERRREMFG